MWIAVIAVFVALLCAAIQLSAELSRWASATAHTSAASAQPAQAIPLRRPAGTDDSTWPAGQRG